MIPDPYDAVGLSAPVSGIVMDEGRGALVFQLIHGDSLVAVAAWAAGAAGVELVDQTVPWQALVEREETVLLHDPLCPMTPPDFLAQCAELAATDDVVVVGARPVTDTVKESLVDDAGEHLGETIDRDTLLSVCSPIVLPPSVVADLGESGGLPSSDFVELLTSLRQRYDAARVVLVEAPPQARRVATVEDVAVLAALTAPAASPSLIQPR